MRRSPRSARLSRRDQTRSLNRLAGVASVVTALLVERLAQELVIGDAGEPDHLFMDRKMCLGFWTSCDSRCEPRADLCQPVDAAVKTAN
jgi:hypothetical protein